MASDYAKLRRLAAARAVVSILAGMDDEDSDAVASIITADADAEEAGGITNAQRLRLIDVADGAGYGRALADELGNIITVNHGNAREAGAAATIDLIRVLRQIEHQTRMSEANVASALCGTSTEAHFSIAAAATFRLREIGRIVNPLVALLDSAFRADVHAVAAE